MSSDEERKMCLPCATGHHDKCYEDATDDPQVLGDFRCACVVCASSREK